MLFIPLEAQAKQISVGAGPCLGSVVGWNVNAKRAFVMQKTTELCARVDQLQHEVITGQAASIIIRSCINTSLLFLARTVPPSIMCPAAEFLYDHVRDGICRKLALPVWQVMPAFAKLVFPLAVRRGGTGISDMSLVLECAYVASVAETLKQMVFYGPDRPAPLDPALPFSCPKWVPMWPIVLGMHAQGSPSTLAWHPQGGDVVTALTRSLDYLKAEGADDYFEKHLNKSCPALPCDVPHFVNYFSSAGKPVLQLQKHLTSFINKKQHDVVFQHTEGRLEERARLLTNSAPGASLMLTTVPKEPRFEQTTEETRMAFAIRLGISPIVVHPSTKTLLCSTCHVSLLDEPTHPILCVPAMKERTSAHDTIKTTGLKGYADDCGVYAKVEPSELHPEDNMRRVDLVLSFPEGNVLVDVAVIAPLCKTHIKDTAKESQGALIKKETAKCKHHHATSVRHEMEFVPFIADLHGSLGRDAIHLLIRLSAQCPRPRLAGQHPKSRVYEEMAAVAMVILRSVCLVTRLAFADAHAAA